MYEYVSLYSQYMRDDQQIMIRFALTYPDMVSIDMKQDYFITGYKQFTHVYLSTYLSKNKISSNLSYEVMNQVFDDIFIEEKLMRNNLVVFPDLKIALIKTVKLRDKVIDVYTYRYIYIYALVYLEA